MIINASADDPYDSKEGYCRYVLGHVCHALIRFGCFSLEALNFKIRNFDYGLVHSLNKPNEISANAIRNKQ